MSERKYGHKNLIKWVLIEKAPFTASGLNEILAGATTKKDVILIAKVLGYTRRGGYEIVKVEDA